MSYNKRNKKGRLKGLSKIAHKNRIHESTEIAIASHGLKTQITYMGVEANRPRQDAESNQNPFLLSIGCKISKSGFGITQIPSLLAWPFLDIAWKLQENHSK